MLFTNFLPKGVLLGRPRRSRWESDEVYGKEVSRRRQLFGTTQGLCRARPVRCTVHVGYPFDPISDISFFFCVRTRKRFGIQSGKQLASRKRFERAASRLLVLLGHPTTQTHSKLVRLNLAPQLLGRNPTCPHLCLLSKLHLPLIRLLLAPSPLQWNNPLRRTRFIFPFLSRRLLSSVRNSHPFLVYHHRRRNLLDPLSNPERLATRSRHQMILSQPIITKRPIIMSVSSRNHLPTTLSPNPQNHLISP